MNDLTPEDKQWICACINLFIKQAEDAITTSAKLLPIVQKLVPKQEPEPAKAE